jgi:hypothetical protein
MAVLVVARCVCVVLGVCVCLYVCVCVVLLCCGFLSCFLLNGMKRSPPAFSRKKIMAPLKFYRFHFLHCRIRIK